MKKKVVIFRWKLLPLSETFILEQIRSLSEWGSVLLGVDAQVDGLPLDGVNVQCQSGVRDTFVARLLTRLRLLFGRPLPGLVAALGRIRPSLVHVHFATDAVDIWPSVQKANLPLLVTLHGYDISTKPSWWRLGYGGLYRRFYPHRLRQMAKAQNVHFIAVSEAVRKRAIEYGIDEEKLTVSYIGVDARKFVPGNTALSQRPRRILFVGRMVEKKAPLVLIRAFSRIYDKLRDVELVMIGEGPQWKQAKALACTLDLPVSFLGSCSAAEVLEQMQESRVFCLPSVTADNGDAEGFGLVLLEAQAAGLPVVTSALYPDHEGVVDGKTGFMVAENDEEDLAIKLSILLEDDALWTEFSFAARDFVERGFDVSAHTKRLEGLYDQYGI